MTVFETERLVVREWTGSPPDLARCFDMYSRWEVVRWLGSVPRAMTAPEEAPAAVRRFHGRSTDPPFGVWAAQVRSNGVIAGTVLLVPLPDSAGEVEVGWHLHPDSWGQGYATEAGAGAIAHGFAAGLTEVYAVVRPDNTPSLAVCRRLGMAPLGRTSRWYGVELEAFRVAAPAADRGAGQSSAGQSSASQSSGAGQSGGEHGAEPTCGAHSGG